MNREITLFILQVGDLTSELILPGGKISYCSQGYVGLCYKKPRAERSAL